MPTDNFKSFRIMTEDEKIVSYTESHKKLQEGLEGNEICIREGVVLNVNKSSRFPFEFFCFRSPDCVLELNKFIEYAFGKSLLLDIGAHHGLFSLVFSDLNEHGEVFAFEPSTSPYEILEYNISGNSRIYTANVALGDKTCSLPMKKEWDHFILDNTEQPEYYVQCIKGDDYFDLKTFPDIIKLDVEGQELKVLKGLNRIISQAHPIIFLELHPQRVSAYGDSVNDICSLLIKWGYWAVDTKTDLPISYEQINNFKEGDLRLLLK